MSRTRKRLYDYDFLEDFSTDDIRWIECPLEPHGTDKVKSCEVNRTTGQYYCHNCKDYGSIADLNRKSQNKLLY